MRRGGSLALVAACASWTSGAAAQTVEGRCGATPREQAQHGWQVQAQGQWVEAERCLRQAVAAAGDRWSERHRRLIDSSLVEVGRHVGGLMVSGGVPGARVLVDGVEVATLPMSQPARVLAGNVLLRVEAPRHHWVERRVAITAGAPDEHPAANEVVVLAPETPTPEGSRAPPTPPVVPVVVVQPPPPPVTARVATRSRREAHGSRLRAIGWLGVAASGATLVTGAVLLGVRELQIVTATNAGCGEALPMYGPGDCTDLHASTSSLQTVGVTSLVAGGLLAAGGLVLVMLAPTGEREARSSARWACGTGPGTVGVACAGAF